MAAAKRRNPKPRKASPTAARAYRLGLYNPILQRMRKALERTKLNIRIPAVLPKEKVKP